VPLSEGGLRLSSLPDRAQSLGAKQACHRLASGGRPAQHIAYWVGLRLRHILPDLAPGPHAEAIPDFYKDLADLLLEVFHLPEVRPNSLAEVRSAYIYSEFAYTPPRPKVEARLPDLPWHNVWCRFGLRTLPAEAVDAAFSALHNILPLHVRCHRFRIVPSPACPRCAAPAEDVLHFFTACSQVASAWEFLCYHVARCLGGLPHLDRLVLFLAWPPFPPSPLENAVVLAIVTYIELAWSARARVADLTPEAVRAAVTEAAAGGPLCSISTAKGLLYSSGCAPWARPSPQGTFIV
jgi:hypothetical protein